MTDSDGVERDLNDMCRHEPAWAANRIRHLTRVAEDAMHELLHVDAHMDDRVGVARRVALATGHRWPPYDTEEE